MAITQVATIAALIGEGKPDPAEGVRFVKNHSSTDDDGGGAFEWDDTSDLPDNNGTVIRPNDVDEEDPGRWIRQVDVRGPCHAEWFGAKGDGTTNDLAAIQACLNDFGRVDLLAKTYVIDTNRIKLRSNDLVQGQGIDKTTIVFKWKYSGPATRIQAFYNQSLNLTTYAYDPTENAVIRDLTVDCWFNSSSRRNTRSAIGQYGAGNLVERVKVINFGVGYDSLTLKSAGECFPIFLSTGARDNTGVRDNARLGTIRDCVVTDPGTYESLPANLPVGFFWPEITALAVTGGGKWAIFVQDPEFPDDPSKKIISEAAPVVGVGGVVVGNRVHDIPKDTSTTGAFQPSPVHGISVAACRGAEVADNEVVNCDGSGVYIVSWTDEDVVVRNNRLINVNIGGNLGVSKSELGWDNHGDYDPRYGLYPYHFRTRIEDNVIVLGRVSRPLDDTNFALMGISLYIGALTGVPEPDASTIRLKDVIITRNLIRGDLIEEGTEKSYPIGVRLFFIAPIFDGLKVENNTLDIPDADATVFVDQNSSSYSAGFNTPYENSLVFWPQWLDARLSYHRPERARIHGNRNLSEQDLRLKVNEWQRTDGVLTVTPPVHMWREFSDRLSRYRSPVFDVASRCYYDEFLGAIPRSALGWVDASTGDAEVVGEAVAQVAQGDEHPGVVRLQAGSSVGVAAILRYGSASVRLGDGATHVFEFTIKRSGKVDPGSDNYQVRMGLVTNVSSNYGVYFNVEGVTDANAYVGWARSSTASAPFVPWNTYHYAYQASDDKGWLDNDAVWRTCRIEIVPNPTAGVSLAARFYWDGVLIGEARNETGSSPIPTDPMYVVFKVDRLSAGTTPRWILLDNFQHVVL